MPKPCDACQEANAVVYCKADTAYLCVGCDSKVHGANKLASRHERVWMCEVCEQAPAVVSCKADAAALCVSCDNDIHSANPLASRHERIPVTPFFDSPIMDKFAHANGQVQSLLHDEQECGLMLKEEEEENSAVEAASWLLPHPNLIPRQVTDASDKDVHLEDDKEDSDMENSFYSKPPKDYIKGHTMDLFSDVDPYLDLDFVSAMGALQPATDSLVPTEVLTDSSPVPSHESESYDIELQHKAGHGYCPPDLSQMSSSSIDVGVVPDASLSDISTPHSNMSVFDFSQRAPNLHHATPLEPLAREARVLRYREKRKNRKFEKTIRYASRKAYAETRPRIKGRFAKRTTATEVEQMYAVVPDGAFGVVPSF